MKTRQEETKKRLERIESGLKENSVKRAKEKEERALELKYAYRPDPQA
jgi:hypothetical protein